MNVEKVFSLSNELIDKKGLQFEEIYYYLPPKFSKDLESSLLYSAMWTLDAYYHLEERFIDIDIGYQHNNLIREIIKNSRWHGGSKDNFPTYFGLFINKEKFILGCYDGGEYFKSKDIKEIWENKNKLNEFHDAKQYGIGYHFGYNYFKDKFDEIKIDNEEGTFYGIVNVNNYLIKYNSLKKE
jgi:hypothetical protein